MTSLAEIKKEMQLYVAQAMEIEKENATLKQQVRTLERELAAKQPSSNLDASTDEILSQAKAHWREETIAYCRKMRDEAYRDCDDVIRRISATATQSDAGRMHTLSSSLIRLKYNEITAQKQSQEWYALAATAHSFCAVFLRDFDIVDGHVALVNGTESDINLQHYSIRLRLLNITFRSNDVVHNILRPGHSISVWWKGDASIRQAPSSGSYFWSHPSIVSSAVDAREVAELLSRSGEVIRGVAANQHDESLHHHPQSHQQGPFSGTGGVGAATPGPSSGSKRKRGGGTQASALQSPPTGHHTATNKRSRSSDFESRLLQSPIVTSDAFDGTSTTVARTSATVDWTDFPFLNRANSQRSLDAVAMLQLPKPSLARRCSGCLSIFSAEVFHVQRPAAVIASAPDLWSHGAQSSSLPSSSTFTSTSNSNALLASVGTLLSGAWLQLQRVIAGTQQRTHVRIVLNNASTNKAMDVSGWALLAVSHPSQRFTLPPGAVVPANGQLTITSLPSSSLLTSSSSVSTDVVLPSLALLASHLPHPRSLHLLNAYDHNVCEKVEEVDLSGIFTFADTQH